MLRGEGPGSRALFLLPSHRLEAQLPDFARRALVDVGEDGVEAAQAGETRARRHLRHRQPRLVEQPFGALHAHRARDLQRARTDMTLKQAIEMTRTDAEPKGEIVDAGAVERAAADQPHGTLH